MNVEPEVLAVAGTIVGGIVAGLVKVYADLSAARARIDAIQTERLANAQQLKVEAIDETKILAEAVSKAHALAEGAGLVNTRRTRP